MFLKIISKSGKFGKDKDIFKKLLNIDLSVKLWSCAQIKEQNEGDFKAPPLPSIMPVLYILTVIWVLQAKCRTKYALLCFLHENCKKEQKKEK